MSLSLGHIEAWRMRLKDAWKNGDPTAIVEIDALCDMALAHLGAAGERGEEPWAYAVFQAKGSEFDYMIYPNREDAENDSQVVDEGVEPIPLYPQRRGSERPSL